MISRLTWEEFLKVYYYTGGIARYLWRFAMDGNCDAMNKEIKQQMQQFIQSCTIEVVCESMINIGLTSKVHELSPALLHGMAYVLDSSNDLGYLTSPKCIHMVLKQKDFAIASSSDWRKLELLTLFMIQHVKCEVTNYAKNTILLPTPSVRWDQDQVGKLPSDLAKKP